MEITGLGTALAWRFARVFQTTNRPHATMATPVSRRARLFMRGPYSMNPRSAVAKWPMFGKTVDMSLLLTPNHFASVALY